MIVFRIFFTEPEKIPHIPYTPTPYRTIPYTENLVPYIMYGTLHRDLLHPWNIIALNFEQFEYPPGSL